MYNVTMNANKITKKVRKEMNISGKAKCEICETQDFLQEHHIGGRKIPKANHRSNLVNICASCHVKVHMGDIIIEGWFMTSAGSKLYWHSKNSNNYLVSKEGVECHIITSQKDD